MPPTPERTTDLRIWIVSSLFFVFIIAGGTFLGLYIAHPETEENSWYPVAGMVLVAIPWFFWFMTFCYRCCLKAYINPQVAVAPPNKGGGWGIARSAPANAAGDDSPGDDDGAWRVGVEQAGGADPGHGAGRNSHDGSARTSGESERPLARSP
ncbi:hypothetical protein ACLOJK_016815 [Asimina triloba]